MKKYALILLVSFLFIFNLNLAHALAPGCSSAGPYNTITGAPCDIIFNSPAVINSSGDTSPQFVSFSAIPTNITTGQVIPFIWKATDVNNDNLLWGVDWGDGSTAAAVICPSFPSTGAGLNWTHSDSHAWTSGGNFTVTVFVSDCKGATTKKSFPINVGSGAPNTQISYNPFGVNPVPAPSSGSGSCTLISALPMRRV